MIVTEPRILEDNKFVIEPPVKKMRSDSGSSEHNIESPVTVRNLELESVKTLFQDYDLLESEAVSCVICGKNYKSKVCVKKHLWEHSVYWDLFDGLKKQQRVLSIQAAIILAIKFNPSLSLLLVTNSSSGNKKKEKQQQQQQQQQTQQQTSDKLQQQQNVDIQQQQPCTSSTISTQTSTIINRKRKAEYDDMVSKPLGNMTMLPLESCSTPTYIIR